MWGPVTALTRPRTLATPPEGLSVDFSLDGPVATVASRGTVSVSCLPAADVCTSLVCALWCPLASRASAAMTLREGHQWRRGLQTGDANPPLLS